MNSAIRMHSNLSISKSPFMMEAITDPALSIGQMATYIVPVAPILRDEFERASFKNKNIS